MLREDLDINTNPSYSNFPKGPPNSVVLRKQNCPLQRQPPETRTFAWCAFFISPSRLGLVEPNRYKKLNFVLEQEVVFTKNNVTICGQ